jgi:hypothetical protein
VKRALFVIAAVVDAPALVAELLLRLHNPIQSRVRGDRIVLLANRT